MILFEFVCEVLQFRVGHVAFANGGKSSDRRQQSRQQHRWKIQFHLLQFFAEQPRAGMPANDHFRRRVANFLGGERLVSRAVLQQAAAMDA